MPSPEEKIFKKGSTTYYFSSQFFPTKIREDVFKLYSFVRVADDYVDSVPARRQEFAALRQLWDAVKSDDSFSTSRHASDALNQRIIKNIVFVMRRYDFDPAWIEAFFDSMQADLDQKVYKTLDDTLWYVYGSAEVVGLMMAKIMGLPDEALQAARLQGRSMQFINFIRDITEDTALGRCYFPHTDFAQTGLEDLSLDGVQDRPGEFEDFMRLQTERYSSWQSAANEGFDFIPRRLRIPLQTAVDMYDWTAKQIEQDPAIVFEKKIKPRKRQVLVRGLYNGKIILPGF